MRLAALRPIRKWTWFRVAAKQENKARKKTIAWRMSRIGKRTVSRPNGTNLSSSTLGICMYRTLHLSIFSNLVGSSTNLLLQTRISPEPMTSFLQPTFEPTAWNGSQYLLQKNVVSSCYNTSIIALALLKLVIWNATTHANVTWRCVIHCDFLNSDQRSRLRWIVPIRVISNALCAQSYLVRSPLRRVTLHVSRYLKTNFRYCKECFHYWRYNNLQLSLMTIYLLPRSGNMTFAISSRYAAPKKTCSTNQFRAF